jgi:hypothetical protein
MKLATSPTVTDGSFGISSVPPPPDLQELVARHGGYDKITADAWRAFDCAMNEWRQALRTRMPTLDRNEREVAAVRLEQNPAPAPIVNPFFGHCACRAPGLYAMHEGFSAKGRVLWFCQEHKPDFRMLKYEHDLRVRGSTG